MPEARFLFCGCDSFILLFHSHFNWASKIFKNLSHYPFTESSLFPICFFSAPTSSTPGIPFQWIPFKMMKKRTETPPSRSLLILHPHFSDSLSVGFTCTARTRQLAHMQQPPPRLMLPQRPDSCPLSPVQLPIPSQGRQANWESPETKGLSSSCSMLRVALPSEDLLRSDW